MTTPTPSPSPCNGGKITPAELSQLFQALKQQLNERLDGIEEDLAALREGLATAASQPPRIERGIGRQPPRPPVIAQHPLGDC